MARFRRGLADVVKIMTFSSKKDLIGSRPGPRYERLPDETADARGTPSSGLRFGETVFRKAACAL
jgi:hypothetical protein